MSARDWSLKAGLSQGVVGQMKRGQMKGGSSPATFDALARVANVSAQWLAEGKGKRSPYQAVPVTDLPEPMPRSERYGNLTVVLEYWGKMRPDRWSKAAIAAALSMGNHADPNVPDPEPAQWEERLDALDDLVHGRKSAGKAVVGSTTPPRGRKR